MTQNNFFPQTQAFEVQIGNANSFLWACYSGLWHLFSEARRLHDTLGVEDWKKAEKYLMPGAPGAGGVDLRQIAIRRDWPQHEDEFEQNILIQMSVLYEDWATSVCAHIDPGFERAAELLQFPSSMPRTKFRAAWPKTWVAWKAVIDANPSSLIQSEFQPPLLTRYTREIAQIDALLRWYRFFKECRNSRVHAGGFHSQASVDAYAAANVATLKSCGIRRDLTLAKAPIVGEPASIGTRGALLGLAVVSHLANAFDAILCHSQACQAHMLAKLIDASKSLGRLPSSDPSKRRKHIRSILGKAHVPLPDDYAVIDAYLQTHDLIKF